MLPYQIDEEKHLKETQQLIRENIGKLEKRVDQVHQETEELNDRITPRDRELNSQMSQQLTIANAMLSHTRNLLRKNVTAYSAPYFGRIDYREEKTALEAVYYIGKNGIQHDDQIVVVDWRAPVAKVYYENELGAGAYEVPEGAPIEIDLCQKRTFDIEGGVLNGWYDSDVAANDELLVKYLAKHKDVVLSDIIATIQKEQDAIIRGTPYQNIIVQGVAGSGKTTVALHRISHILYNYAHRYTSDRFLIIGSSDMLLSYIASGLPDLDVNGVVQRRMDAFFREELYEDWKDKYEIVEELPENAWKCHLDFAKALDKWLEKQWLKILRPRAVEDEELGEILSRDQVYDLLNYRRDWSLLRIENLLNQMLQGRIQMLTDVVSDEDVFKKMRLLRAKKLKEYSNYYHQRKNWADALFIYEQFVMEYAQGNAQGTAQGTSWSSGWSTARNTEQGGAIDASKAQKRLSQGQLSVYDLAAMCLVRRYFTEDEPSPAFGQIIIDEAQDFGEAIYYYLKKLQKGCYFTIMGDVSQNIHFEIGMNSWDAMTQGIFNGEKDRFELLQKSYRNTIEISEYAAKVLEKASGSRYRIEPVIRHGDPVRIWDFTSSSEDEPILPSQEGFDLEQENVCQSEDNVWNRMIRQAAKLFNEAEEKGFRSGALVCRTQKEADKVRAALEAVMESGKARQLIPMVLPLEQVKGLEFDVVLIWEPTERNYPADSKNAKLLYVAITRALHELHLLTGGPLTKLLE